MTRSSSVDPTRLHDLNDDDVRSDGRFVLLWMQAAQRAQDNHALEYAVEQANRLDKPLLAAFGLTDRYPEANARHYAFMLEGLAETADALEARGVPLVMRQGQPDEVIIELAAQAAMVVVDAGYVRIQRQWRRRVAEEAGCRLVEVETDLVVPIRQASDKEEYAARTIRKKLQRRLDEYLRPVKRVDLRASDLALKDSLGSDDASDPAGMLASLDLDRTVAPSAWYRGGPKEAHRRLTDFINHRLADYVEGRNQPAEDCVSHMSPYLHFGQISPIAIALAVREQTRVQAEARDAYLEELIVRRELAYNFVYFNPDYDRYDALPAWALRTLAKHADDPREYVYSLEDLDQARTHDPYWNAAQQQMVVTGFMHNYMRMYWGKKIMEWTSTPREAFAHTLYLNNRYELDGRNPNSFAGVAWCFGKHDRPWQERPVFGQTRYMNANGLKRKCDIEAYVRQVDADARRGKPA